MVAGDSTGGIVIRLRGCCFTERPAFGEGAAALLPILEFPQKGIDGDGVFLVPRWRYFAYAEDDGRQPPPVSTSRISLDRISQPPPSGAALPPCRHRIPRNQDSPVPIVMVGSQRSSDRPSSDAAVNLINAVKAAAQSDIAEVMVCMFGPTSDEYCLLHRGTRVRKMHSSYRSTFRTIGDIPLAMIDRNRIDLLRQDYRRRRDDRNVSINTSFEEKVTILYYYPNMHADIVDAIVEKGYRGLIIAGTGLGHINKRIYSAIQRAADAGVHIFMTVQTLWGYVQMYVYETGREIMQLGVSAASNMLPEVAYMKLCWTLGQTDDREEVRRIMLTPVVDEITDREPYNGYLVFQGRIPEIQEFLRSVHR